jgi:mediator of RNA polymerase II transcription subunit 23
MESTALKLILGLSSAEVLAIPQFARIHEPKTLISNESEELNKVLALTLARAIHVTGSESLSAAGNWCKELLSSIMSNTPLSWSSSTLNCFPPVIAEFFKQNSGSLKQENKDTLKKTVEEEYKKWKAMNNDNDKINHFSGPQSSTLFLCLLWKMVSESENRNNAIPGVAYKILDRIGARGLSVHLRSFADFVVNEIALSVGRTEHLKKHVDSLNDLIWKCNVITLDRFLLCLSLRAFEGNNSKVCLLICMLLLERDEFKKRVECFVSENSPEHWKQSDWHARHVAFQEKHPEKLFFENLEGVGSHQYLPVYFSNICLRFIPVIDIIIHKFIEVPAAPISIEKLLDSCGCLYKFHEKPITYLYNTLHFYELKLKEKPDVKRKLVGSIVGAFKDVRPNNWAISESYQAFVEKAPEETSWTPDLDYYIRLMNRLVDTLAGKPVFPHMDWRFSEFPNASAHALHVTCIELMALPVPATTVASQLLDVCLVGHKIIPRHSIESWMNAVGLVLTALPDSYWSVLLDRILEIMQSPSLSEAGVLSDPFKVMDFKGSHSSMSDVQIGYMIALTHAVWHHASVGQVSLLTSFLKERVKPKLQTEEQFIFVCHLLGPFLQRFYVERTRIVMDVTIELYELLGIIDQKCENLRFIDSICDLLYHIKYMFTGDSVKNEVETIIRNLRAPLQLRLRFITHLNIDEVMGS